MTRARRPGKLTPPNWSKRWGASGGNLADVRPVPVVRQYPHDGCPRPIYVSVTTWRGISIGAQHYYARIEENFNCVWDGRTIEPYDHPCWRRCWDDEAGKGRRFEGDFLTREEARNYVRDIVAMHFGDKEKYEVIDRYTTNDAAWAYGRREGD